MNKIKGILNKYWVAYIMNAITFIILNYNKFSILPMAAGIVFSWGLLTIICLVFENHNQGGLCI